METTDDDRRYMSDDRRFVPVAEALRRAIGDGTLQPGRIDVAALCGEHGVSRVTVRRALGVLTDEGLLSYRHGDGWTLPARRRGRHVDGGA